MAVDSTHVVFGATGGIGGALVAELMRRGKAVRAVSRRGAAPEGAEGAAADAADAAAAAAAARGAGVVYHCVNPGYTRWPELLPPISRSILGAAESSGAKLVFADNLIAYGPVEGPIREDLPATASGRKGRTRVELPPSCSPPTTRDAFEARSEGPRTTTGPAAPTRTPGSPSSGGSSQESGRSGPGSSTCPTPSIICPTSLVC